jgi:hypothetical protein
LRAKAFKKESKNFLSSQAGANASLNWCFPWTKKIGGKIFEENEDEHKKLLDVC